MSERPIIFSAPMVRALLTGDKTQTRRVVTPTPDDFMPVEGQNWPMREINWPADGRYDIGYQAARGDGKLFQVIRCPYGAPGDRLWVRETFCFRGETIEGRDRYRYRADENPATDGWRWTPAIHMPRRACRLVLEVTGVRVERLRDISVKDCWVEGIEPGAVPAKQQYQRLWDSLNEKRGLGWPVNPWVWVVEFRRADKLKVAA